MEAHSVFRWHSPSPPINGFPSHSIPCLGTKIPVGAARKLLLERKGFCLIFKSSISSRLRIKAAASDSNVPVFDRPEPFGGKSGSVSFSGLTHHVIEEGEVVSSPFNQGKKGSFVWVLAPVVLISSLVLPQLVIENTIDSFIKNEVLAGDLLDLFQEDVEITRTSYKCESSFFPSECYNLFEDDQLSFFQQIMASVSSEVAFYLGLAAFLLITEHVQKPYLQFSSKRWGLITGLNGYLTSTFFTMGFKVLVPLIFMYITWPSLGLAAAAAVVPFLLGCAAQFAFEVHLDKRGSSCWPLVPIIFEVYRLYQLSKAANFVERLMLSMKGAAASPDLIERSGALVTLLLLFQILGLLCLWSMATFLLRLFPSRPVAENY